MDTAAFTEDDRRTVADVAFAGQATFETGFAFGGTEVGGLSGITHDADRGVFAAISDDGDARFYTLTIDLADGNLEDGDVVFTGVTILTAADGTPFDPAAIDAEGIARTAAGALLVASEGSTTVPADPFVKLFSAAGAEIDALPVDDKFLPSPAPKGIRNNLGFESLTLTQDKTRLFTATENALLQDGPAAAPGNGSLARIVEYNALTGEAVAEYGYLVEPVPDEAIAPDAFSTNGLVELLAIDNEGTLLALERSFSVGVGNTVKLFEVRTQGATNLIGADAVETALEDGEIEANVDEVVTKRLIADLADFGVTPDNVEGMTFGPDLPDGRKSVILVSDNDFNGDQFTQFLALSLDLATVPTVTPVLETPDELRFPGPEPIVIAHRGASGDRPEHTLEAYALAIEQGADFIEPDLVTTRDGVLIARHEPFLATVATDEDGKIVLDANGDPVVTFATTNVAELPQFRDRLTVKELIPGFQTVAGWFAEDFTLAEIKELRAREDQPELRPQSAAFDDQFEIPTLSEIIALVKAAEAETGREIGIYPETKEPSYLELFGTHQNEDANGNGVLDAGEDINGNGSLDVVAGGAAIGIDTSRLLIDTLLAEDFTDPDRIFIQSFEIANLLELQNEIMPAAGLDLPLVQLIAGNTAFPTVDILVNLALGLPGADPSVYGALDGFVTAETTFGDIISPDGLAAIAGAYAEGIGPSIGLLFGEDGDETGLVADAQAAGLVVHAYTHRDETAGAGPDGAPLSPTGSFQAILATGVDGVFTDNPDTGRAAVDEIFEEGPDPDDPAVWFNERDPAESRIFTAMKNGGLRVYDLQGNEIQRIEPDGVRYNNVDIVYDFQRGGVGLDLAVFSDRANDALAIYVVDVDGRLIELTGPNIPETIFGVDDGEATAYGLATYTSLVDGTPYAFVTQADGSQIAQIALKLDDWAIGYEVVRILDLPVPEGEDPADFQAEGIAIDRETGIGYVAVEEELGLLTFDAEPGGSDGFELVASIEEDFLDPDIEGVTIHYGEDGEGLILVSSQGDSTFAAFDRIFQTYLGSFAITGADGIDGVEESDGVEIFSDALPGFENGLLVTQDGSNEPAAVFADPEDGEIQNFNVNFKVTDLGAVLDLLGVAPETAFDPRAILTATLPNGVASGDVSQDSAVLWTRSLVPGEVTFRVFALTPRGEELLVATQTATASDPDVPVKVLVEGLEPGTEHLFEVQDAAGARETGRFSTAAEAGRNGLTFGVTGDWRGDLAPYPAIANAVDADLDFFVQGGDTIYADFDSPALPSTLELDGFRTKYQEVYGSRAGENFWAELRGKTPVFATIDDHEVVNDFAGGAPAASDPRLPEGDGLVNDTDAFEEGLQAFQEYHPIEDRFYGDTGDARTAFERELYRSQTFGEDAAVFILDQRSFRDEQIASVFDPTDREAVARFLEGSLDPSRTLLAEVQLERLKADLLAAEDDGVTWKFVYTPEPIQALGLNNADSWDGYQAERNEILKFIEDNDIDNVVFVAADIHATFVNNLTYAEEPFGEQIATSVFEITTGSVGFAPPFGPTVVEVATLTGLISPEERALYDRLPIAPDPDTRLDDKDDFLTFAFNATAIEPAGLDPIGLDANLPQADGLIDARLLEGDWVSAHTYGWTEFDIDAATQALTVTTYGIPFYTPEEVAADPEAILALDPQVVSRFVVNPTLEPVAPNRIEATPRSERLQGTDETDVFVFAPGTSPLGRADLVTDLGPDDLIDLSAFGFAGVERGLSGAFEADALSVSGGGGQTVLAGGAGALLVRVNAPLASVVDALVLEAPAEALV